MIPALLLAGATLASGIGSSVASYYANQQNIQAQKDINNQTIQATQQNNALARAWALEDWQRTNEYNSPLQQMQRLREAGLNPNLVYGNGAQNTAQMVARSDVKTPNLNAPHSVPIEVPNLGGVLENYFNVRSSESDLEIKNAQKVLLDQQRQMNDLKLPGMMLDNAKKEFSLTKDKALYDSSLEAAKFKNRLTFEQINKTAAERAQTEMETKYIPLKFDLQRQQLRLAQAKTEAEISQIHAETAKKIYENANLQPAQLHKLDKEIDYLNSSGKLKEWEYQMRSMGLNPNDPAWVRVLTSMAVKLAKKYGIDIGDYEAGVMDDMKFGKDLFKTKNVPAGGWIHPNLR